MRCELAHIEIRGHKFEVQVACTSGARSRGLMGAPALSNNMGLLIVYSIPFYYPVWMYCMRFAIDVVWIDAGNTVVGYHKNIQPAKNIFSALTRMICPPVPVTRILELSAGAIDRCGIKTGDRVVIVQ